MACIICGSLNNTKKVWDYFEPDKYEKYVGIDRIKRRWQQCGGCGIYRQYRNYKIEILSEIYKHGYRDKKFRGETIENAFNRIMLMPLETSENKQRVEWLKDVLPMTEGTMLDVGSGIGVFPFLMKDEWDVTCVEENADSILFINSKLGMPCVEQVKEEKFDLVTLVHVLEHIEDLPDFLAKIYKHAHEFLFVEVPDADEFIYLPRTHDEFNSCHEWFFTMPTLVKLLEDNGFTVLDATRKYYGERQLSRLLVFAQCG